ncbi:conserved protein of unknown function (plasmid) [Rhodovastum atsumiense]|uniref:Uncharacterized protein n=1 Tax=Rhodovastum atsumiense TaxID=504468 RepID=A0A5M6IU86_9PROT|nr:hypothetical protein [Rhodovastum atsumiense]KAA5611880.1 hypothetical protein F1189_12675 [Rhodovastum atsumiense]CAH2606140.1 conserved protein of unknown function [Rhodovastum atsumiense]
MAGMIGGLAIGLGVTGLLQTAVGGADLTIGGVGLGQFESPESVGFGGEQKLAVHEFANGARVVDAMGASDRPIEFSGTLENGGGLVGGGASAKARRLDAMRIAGKRVPLVWGDYYREVVVQRAEFDYTLGGALIPYRISCVVVPTTAPETRPSLLQQLGRDLTDALGITDTIGPALATAQGLLTTAQDLMPVVGVITAGSPTFGAISSAVGLANGAVGAGLSLTDATFSAAASTGEGLPAGASGLSTLANMGKSLAGFAGLSGLTGRAAANVANAGA